MNIFQKAKSGIISPDVEHIAEKEGYPADQVLDLFAKGEIVIFRNSQRDINPLGVGTGLTTKVNANIGSSPDLFDLDTELEKLDAAVRAGADAVMDLSTGGDLSAFRRQIIEKSSVPLGTVPLYQVAVEMVAQEKSMMDMTIEDYLKVIRQQAEEGVDFMTIHSGVTRESMESLHSQERLVGITSRGGSIIAEWMYYNKKQSPLFEYYDEILDILAPFNVVISLGDGLRPGGLHDASDRGQIHEMVLLGELARRARERGVQAIIEGPGHVPLNMVADNMKLEKAVCDRAPYYVLGPLVTDVAPGYDHITGAIGGAIAAASGADFLCYVTPAEHLRLPTAEDVHEGVIASKIAAHAGDIVKYGDRAKEWDNRMSRARKERDWESMFSLALDENKARQYRGSAPSGEEDQCTMCGEFCAIKRKY